MQKDALQAPCDAAHRVLCVTDQPTLKGRFARYNGLLLPWRQSRSPILMKLAGTLLRLGLKQATHVKAYRLIRANSRLGLTLIEGAEMEELHACMEFIRITFG